MIGFIYLVFAVIYASMLLAFYSRWRIRSVFPSKNLQSASIIVPFRNESSVLFKTLPFFLNIDADEVIFCNDHSEDNSSQIIRDFLMENKLKHWKLINSLGVGKKAAISTAVQYAESECIITTDADCIVPKGWAENMLTAFEDPNIQMACGPVTVTRRNTFLEKYQIAEWASISLLTNYFFYLQRPVTCSAANMAYRKSAFLAVKGYDENEHVSSGDDEFLLKKISTRFGAQSIHYFNHPEVLVKTFPTKNLLAYISQRARWAGKWKAHRQWSHAGTALLFFFISLFQLSSISLLFMGLEGKLLLLLFWVLKFGAEYLVLGRTMKSYQTKLSLKTMFLVSVFQPFSVIVIGIFSIFVKNSWKGRVVLTKA